jgi:hypothetical protein
MMDKIESSIKITALCYSCKKDCKKTEIAIIYGNKIDCLDYVDKSEAKDK